MNSLSFELNGLICQNASIIRHLLYYIIAYNTYLILLNNIMLIWKIIDKYLRKCRLKHSCQIFYIPGKASRFLDFPAFNFFSFQKWKKKSTFKIICKNLYSIDEMLCGWMQNTSYNFQQLFQSKLDVIRYILLAHVSENGTASI